MWFAHGSGVWIPGESGINYKTKLQVIWRTKQFYITYYLSQNNMSHTVPPQLFYMNKILFNSLDTVQICNPHHANLDTMNYWTIGIVNDILWIMHEAVLYLYFNFILTNIAHGLFVQKPVGGFLWNHMSKHPLPIFFLYFDLMHMKNNYYTNNLNIGVHG